MLIHPSNVTVIYLAAGRGERMKDIAVVPKPLLTIGDQAAISLALQPFVDYGFRKFSFILGTDGNLIEYYVRSNYTALELSFHYIDEALGTAHSLYQVRHIYPCQPIIACHADNIYLDKHFNNIDFNNSFLFVNRDPILKSYAYVNEEDSNIVGAVEKPNKFYSDLVISGLFYFSNSEHVWHATECNFYHNKKSHLEWSLSDTVDTMVNELGITIKIHLIDTPIHFGTPEEYEQTIHVYDTKSELISRAMNKITLVHDGNKKMIRKESKTPFGETNLDPEIAYLRSIPQKVQRHFPELLSFTARYYEMEYIEGSDISNLAHKGRIKFPQFTKMLNNVIEILKNDFHYHTLNANKESILFECFIKTQQRLRSFQSALKLDTDKVIINGTECFNPIFLVNELLKSLEVLRNFEKTYFTIIHGDLNLTNIMYDSENDKIRFLDPRGKYGSETFIYGDPSYDIMRLIACVGYGYDTIVIGDYLMEVNQDNVDIKVNLPDVYINSRGQLADCLSSVFPDIPPINYELQAILYFLNLLPFHSDSIERSLAFYYWGTYQLNKWVKQQGNEYGIVH